MMIPYDHREDSRTRFRTCTLTEIRRYLRELSGYSVYLWTPIGWFLTNRTTVARTLKGEPADVKLRISLDDGARRLYLDWCRR